MTTTSSDPPALPPRLLDLSPVGFIGIVVGVIGFLMGASALLIPDSHIQDFCESSISASAISEASYDYTMSLVPIGFTCTFADNRQASESNWPATFLFFGAPAVFAAGCFLMHWSSAESMQLRYAYRLQRDRSRIRT